MTLPSKASVSSSHSFTKTSLTYLLPPQAVQKSIPAPPFQRDPRLPTLTKEDLSLLAQELRAREHIARFGLTPSSIVLALASLQPRAGAGGGGVFGNSDAVSVFCK